MAAAGGNLRVLMWLREIGCPWDSATSAAAFQEGHLEMLSWLGQQVPPCPWAGVDLICPAEDAPGSCLMTLIPQQLTANKPCLKLLGQALDPRFAAASCCSQGSGGVQQDVFLRHLQHVLNTRTAACIKGLDTNYIDSFVVELLEVWLKPFTSPEPISRIAKMLMHSNSQEALAWLLINAQHLGRRWLSWHSDLLSEAFSAGHVWVLELLSDLPGLNAYYQMKAGRDFERSIGTANAASIAWLHQHRPACFGVKTCKAAAQRGKLELLQILRDLQPPCPWNSSVSRAALHGANPQVLQWMLLEVPPCPIDLQDARAVPLMVIASGHLPLLQQIWPVAERPQAMYQEVARHGHLDMLRWLVDQQPGDEPWAKTTYIAAKHDRLDMVQFLLARGPHMFVSNPEGVKGRCLMAMAQAGCPMSYYHKGRVSDLMRPWLTIMGLLRWARGLQSAREPSCLAAVSDLSTSGQITAVGGNRLLAMMADLPKEIADKIVDQAVLSPAMCG